MALTYHVGTALGAQTIRNINDVYGADRNNERAVGFLVCPIPQFKLTNEPCGRPDR